jgi:hypothetical protein
MACYKYGQSLQSSWLVLAKLDNFWTPPSDTSTPTVIAILYCKFNQLLYMSLWSDAWDLSEPHFRSTDIDGAGISSCDFTFGSNEELTKDYYATNLNPRILVIRKLKNS